MLLGMETRKSFFQKRMKNFTTEYTEDTEEELINANLNKKGIICLKAECDFLTKPIFNTFSSYFSFKTPCPRTKGTTCTPWLLFIKIDFRGYKE